MPKFLKEDYKAVKDKVKEKGSDIKGVLLEFRKNMEVSDNLYIECDLPEIVKELYCLEYLQQLKNNYDDEKKYNKFIKAAWNIAPQKYMEFLFRIAEDFRNHNFAHLDGIFKCPKNLEQEKYIYYSEVLREMTYWDGSRNEDEVIQLFENMYRDVARDEKKCELAVKIAESYAISLFNIIWFCGIRKKSSIKKESNQESEYLKIMHKIYMDYPDSYIIRKSYESAEKTIETTNQLYIIENKRREYHSITCQ